MKSVKKLLLLNPPGKQKYLRDYYCSKITKGRYYYHPVDLLYLSGRLSKYFELSLIDAIVEHLSPLEVVDKARGINPAIIVFLTSSPSYYEDLEFLRQLKAVLPLAKFVGTGDIYRELRDEAFIEQEFLDAAFFDFSTDDLLHYLCGGEAGTVINNVIYKHGEDLVEGPEIHGKGIFSVGMPRWDLFKLNKYSYPFARRHGFASMLTDFGCPFSCTYCPVSSLGFKKRPINEVIEEMRYLWSLGVREIFFRDQTFGVNHARTLDLCAQMKKEFDFSWGCFSRVDVVKPDMLEAMKNAGCHTIIYGIETTDEKLLDRYKKNTSLNQIYEAVQLTKLNKLRTVGTFLIGLPGDTREKIQATVRFACDVGLDFVSFNIAVPRFGTPFRLESIDKHYIDSGIRQFESAESVPIWKGQILSNEDILELKKWANRAFYLRPRYLFKRIMGLRTWFECWNSLAEAISIIKKNN